jgi:hypothetical protein
MSHRKQHDSITNTNLLLLFMELIAVWYEYHAKHIIVHYVDEIQRFLILKQVVQIIATVIERVKTRTPVIT